MKKLLILAMVLVAASAFGQFRGYTWGAQRAVIIKDNPWLQVDESSAIGKDPKSIYVVSFFFLNDGRLACGAQVPILKGSPTADDWLDKYAEYQGILESKYGAAEEKLEEWTSSTAKSIMDRATGLLYRDLELTTAWTVDGTLIRLKLINRGDIGGEDIFLIILYHSAELLGLYNSEVNARAAEGL